jgi:hypothetical protein
MERNPVPLIFERIPARVKQPKGVDISELNRSWEVGIWSIGNRVAITKTYKKYTRMAMDYRQAVSVKSG